MFGPIRKATKACCLNNLQKRHHDPFKAGLCSFSDWLAVKVSTQQANQNTEMVYTVAQVCIYLCFYFFIICYHSLCCPLLNQSHHKISKDL